MGSSRQHSDTDFVYIYKLTEPQIQTNAIVNTENQIQDSIGQT